MNTSLAHRRIFFGITIFSSLIFLLGVQVHILNAATLSLISNSSEIRAGQPFKVSVVLTSSDQAANAVSGTIHFPATLQVQALSKNNSIISLWPADASYSNEAGTLHFEGVILNPGFEGAAGTVLTITFKGNAPSENSIAFSAASVLANDGQGTEIIKGTSGTNISIGKAQNIVPPTPVPVSSSAPLLSTSSKEQTLSPIINQVIINSGFGPVDLYTIIIIAVIIIILLILFGIYDGYIFYLSRSSVRDIKNKLSSVDKELHSSFSELHTNLIEHSKLLEHKKSIRVLTAEEQLFLERFAHKLEEAQKILDKKINK